MFNSGQLTATFRYKGELKKNRAVSVVAPSTVGATKNRKRKIVGIVRELLDTNPPSVEIVLLGRCYVELGANLPYGAFTFNEAGCAVKAGRGRYFGYIPEGGKKGEIVMAYLTGGNRA